VTDWSGVGETILAAILNGNKVYGCPAATCFSETSVRRGSQTVELRRAVRRFRLTRQRLVGVALWSHRPGISPLPGLPFPRMRDISRSHRKFYHFQE
jgi:hypothetical protein